MKLEHGIYVSMAVKCIGKMCESCPNLHVDTSVSELTSADADGFEKHYETYLQCRGLQRCLRLYNMMEDDYHKYGVLNDDKRT